MYPGSIGSVISSGYLKGDIWGYNLPLMNSRTRKTTGTALIDLVNENIRISNKNDIISKIPFPSKENYSLKPVKIKLNDYHYSLLYFLSVFNIEPSKSKKAIEPISKEIPDYIIDLISEIDFFSSASNVFTGVVFERFDLDYREFKKCDSEKDIIINSFILGFKAGMECTSFEDSLRRVLYSGFHSDISMIVADIIARDRGFLPEKSLEETAMIKMEK